MDEAELMRQLLSAFEAEADEHLGEAARLLVELEQTAHASPERNERIAEIFRLMHSLKGAARAVDLGDVQTLSHAIESLLGVAKAGQIQLEQAHIDLLLKGVDQLDGLVKASLSGQAIAADYVSVVSELDAAKVGQMPVTARKAMVDRPPEESTPAVGPLQPLASPTQPQPQETIRVSTHKVDTLLAHVGEVATAKIRLDGWISEMKSLSMTVEGWTRYDNAERLTAGTSNADVKAVSARLKALVAEATRHRSRLSVATTELQGSIRKLRMLPLNTITATLPRVVRDLARDLEKEVQLQLVGVDAEVDKRIIDELTDDLMHLIRNAIDHGIESPYERELAGKPRLGTLRLSARSEGSQLVLELRDDGRGLDLSVVKRMALECKIVTEPELLAMNETEVLHLVFRSGFSTRQEVTTVSGRGVGLDVVRKQVERLNGRLAVETAAGRWTLFRLTLPLAVTSAEGLLVEAGGQILALPVESIERIVHMTVAEIGTAAGRPAIMVQGKPVALAHLAELLNRPSSALQAHQTARVPVVILASAEQRAALLVDALVGHQEMVVKPLGRQLARVRNVFGAAIMASGDPVIVLNPRDLIKSALRRGKPVHVAPSPVAPPVSARILVADDSITTRTLERMILESAGYTVQTAVDGQEALALLMREPFDLVVSDVDMPCMTGLELTRRLKANEHTREIPVILVTSLDSPEDKEAGVAAGADAYVVKNAFDQGTLLAIVRQFV